MKIIGSLVIILTSVIASHQYEKYIKQKYQDLKALYEFFLYLRNQIEYFTLPLTTIYERYKTDNKSIIDLIENKTTQCFYKPVVTELNSTMSTLGLGYKREQLNKIDYLLSVLTKHITELEASLQQKIKIFRAISMFLGCSLVILLV